MIEASRSHSDTPHSVGHLWTSDQSDAKTSTWQNTTLKRHRHPFPRRESNPQSQQASGRRPRLRLRGKWGRPNKTITVSYKVHEPPVIPNRVTFWVTISNTAFLNTSNRRRNA